LTRSPPAPQHRWVGGGAAIEKTTSCPNCQNAKVGEFLWTCKMCNLVFCSKCEGGGELAIKCPKCGFEAGTMISPGRIEAP
jgi:hypothetical protein